MLVNLLEKCVQDGLIMDDGSQPALSEDELARLKDNDKATVAVSRNMAEIVVDEYTHSAYYSNNDTQHAQPFQLSEPANIAKVKVRLKFCSGGDYNIHCYLQECMDNGDPNPNGQIWEAVNTVNSSEIQEWSDVEFTFSPTVPLQANKLYCVKLVAEGTETFYWAYKNVNASSTVSYRASSDGTSWSIANGYKAYYQIFSLTQEFFDVLIDVVKEENVYAVQEIRVYTDDDNSNNWQIAYSSDGQTWVNPNVSWDSDLAAQKVSFNETTYLRYIKIHYARETEGTTNIYEIEVIADDSRVDFGSDGSLESYNFTEAPSGSYSGVQEIPIYNDCSLATVQSLARIRADGTNGSWYVEISTDQTNWDFAKRHCKHNDLTNHQCLKGNPNYATSACKCTCPDYKEEWLDLGNIAANSSKNVYARSFIPEGTPRQFMGFKLDAKHIYECE